VPRRALLVGLVRDESVSCVECGWFARLQSCFIHTSVCEVLLGILAEVERFTGTAVRLAEGLFPFVELSRLAGIACALLCAVFVREQSREYAKVVAALVGRTDTERTLGGVGFEWTPLRSRGRSRSEAPAVLSLVE
jgi:hypothetical protein